MVEKSKAESWQRALSRRDFMRVAGGGTLALGALGATGLLEACMGGSTPSTGTKQLSFVYLGSAEQQQSWNQLFDEFNKQQASTQLKAVAVPVDNWAAYFDKVSTQIAGGVKYDLVQLATEGVQLFASHGLVEPIDAFVNKDKAAVDDFINDSDPNLIKWNQQYGSPDGKRYYMPIGFNTMCAWLNKDVFKAAGVDIPTDDWTWSDFLSAARKIKSKTGAFMYPATAEYFIGVMPWLLTNGASTLSADWKKATCDSDAAIEAADFVRQLVVEKLSPPPGGAFDRFTLAVQGKLAMFGGGRWPIVNIRQQNAVDKFVIVAWPHKGAAKGSPVGWGAYPIMKVSPNKDAAWEFVKFLMSRHGTDFFAKLGGTIVPSRKSSANSNQFLDNSPVGTEKLYAALQYATPIPSPPKGNLVQRVIEDDWGQILAGSISPRAGMQKMQADVTQNL
jgi:multiple sugar transport system substrate-binding protein